MVIAHPPPSEKLRRVHVHSASVFAAFTLAVGTSFRAMPGEFYVFFKLVSIDGHQAIKS
jgi:hypothetical protein